MYWTRNHFKAVLQRQKERIEAVNTRFDKRKDLSKHTGDKPEFDFPELSAIEQKRLKARIKLKIQKDNFKDYLLFIIIFLVLFIAFYFFMN
ncbi:hypothetical protein N1F78_14820 [Seonamhaeicola sp. MEBiC1930]|uniref:hypothetical protein n=1 Tax=Seonamhaeicola sp. MEBiC01930 TaxID=2976768 RepID=UPI00325075DE